MSTAVARKDNFIDRVVRKFTAGPSEEDLRYEWITCDRVVCDGKPHEGLWRRHARPNQMAPSGQWLIWLILAGRGWGKTRTAAELVKKWGLENPGSRIALIGQTRDDIREVMVEGESGLLSVLPDKALRGGDREKAWNRSQIELFLANGTRYKGYSSETPNKLRGPQQHFAWIDEIATLMDAAKGIEEESTTMSNLLLGLRLGQDPRAIITGTPKRKRVLVGFSRKGEQDYKPGLLDTEGVVLSKGSTYDNLDNLAPTFKKRVLDMFEGTRTGKQELNAEILEDVEGALWQQIWIEDAREMGRTWRDLELVKIVVAVDPATTSGPKSDETGIVVVGKGWDGHAYVLADRSLRDTPTQWAKRIQATYDYFKADAVICESTAGELLVENLEAVDASMNVQYVTAKAGKRLRASPVANLYEQGKVHHLHKFTLDGDALGKLEEQQTTWVPDETPDSPDRVDALVYGVSGLLITGALQVGQDTYTRTPVAGRR